ncbi:ICP22 family protein [Actinoallomurus acanthiterrae]
MHELKLGGGNEAVSVKLLTCADGRQVVEKVVRTPEDLHGELLTSMLGQKIGAPVPRAITDGNRTIYMDYADGKPIREVHQDYEYRTDLPYWNSPEGRRLGLLDLIVGNGDRRDNFLIGPDGNVIGIDHALAFFDTMGANPLDNPFVQKFAEPNGLGGYRMIDSPLTHSDVAYLRQALESLRPEFERLGRLDDWYDQAMGRVNELGQHATGTDPLYGDLGDHPSQPHDGTGGRPEEPGGRAPEPDRPATGSAHDGENAPPSEPATRSVPEHATPDPTRLAEHEPGDASAPITSEVHTPTAGKSINDFLNPPDHGQRAEDVPPAEGAHDRSGPPPETPRGENPAEAPPSGENRAGTIAEPHRSASLTDGARDTPPSDSPGRRAEPTVLDGTPSVDHGPAADHAPSARSLADSVASGVRHEEPLIVGRPGYVDRVTFNDGTTAVRKQFRFPREADAETLASRVGEALGVRVPRVHQDGLTVYMDEVGGRNSRGVVGEEHQPAWADSPEGRMLGVFDVLVQNPDRTPNWHVDENDHIYAIDHSDSFGGLLPGPKLNPFAAHYLKEDRPARPEFADENPLSSHDIHDVRQRLQDVKPEFDRLRRTDWYDGMMERLDELGRHTTGTEPYLVPDPSPREPLPRRHTNAASSEPEAPAGAEDAAPPSTDPVDGAPHGNPPHEPPPGHLASEHLSGGHEPAGRGPAGHPSEGGPTGHEPPSAGTPPAGHQDAAGREPTGHDQPTTNEARFRFRRGRDDDPTPSPEQDQRPTDEQGVHDKRTKGDHTDQEPRTADGSDARRSTPTGEPDPAGTTDGTGRTDEVGDHRADALDGGPDVLEDLPPHQRDAVERLLDDDGVRRLNEALASDDPQVRAEAQAWAQDASEGLSACPVADRETVYHYTSLPADRLAELVPGADVTMHGVLDAEAAHTPDHGQPVELVVHSRSGAVITDRVFFHPETRFRVLAEEHYTLPMHGKGWRPIHRIFLAELPADGSPLPGTVGHPGIDAPRRPMDERLQQVHTYREPTDAGVAYFHPGDDDHNYNIQISQGIKPIDGVFHIDMHADPVVGFVGDEALTGKDIATLLSHEPALADPPADSRLVLLRSGACDSGQERHGLAQDIANETGLIVIAPDKEVWYSTDGTAHVSEPMTFDANGRPRVIYPPEGAWRIFVPEGGHAPPAGHEPAPTGHEPVPSPKDGGTREPGPATGEPHGSQQPRPHEPPADSHGSRPSESHEPPADPYHQRRSAPESREPGEHPVGTDSHAQRREELARSVATGIDPAQTRLLGRADTASSHATGSERVELVTFNDDTHAVRKELKAGKEDQGDREELGALVGGAVDAPVPRVYRESDRVLFMDHVDGDTALAQHPDSWDPSDLDHLGYQNTHGAKILGLLDILIQNNDRHNGNWIIIDGNVFGIDHNLAFHDRAIDTTANSFAEHYADLVKVSDGHYEYVWKHNELSSSDVALIRSRLEALRPEFERLKHPGWYEEMMDRFGHIEENAKGKTSFLASDDLPANRPESAPAHGAVEPPRENRDDGDDGPTAPPAPPRPTGPQDPAGGGSTLRPDQGDRHSPDQDGRSSDPPARPTAETQPAPGGSREDARLLVEGRRVARECFISDPSDSSLRALARMNRILEADAGTSAHGMSVGHPLADLATSVGLDDLAVGNLGRLFNEAQAHGFDPAGAADRAGLVDALNRHRAADPHVWDGMALIDELDFLSDSDTSTLRALAQVDGILGSVRGSFMYGLRDDPLLVLSNDVGMGTALRALGHLFDDVRAHGLDPATVTDRDSLLTALDAHRRSDPRRWEGMVIADHLKITAADDSVARALSHMDEIYRSGRDGNGHSPGEALTGLGAQAGGGGRSIERFAAAFVEAEKQGFEPARAADHEEFMAILDRLAESDPLLWNGLSVAEHLGMPQVDANTARKFGRLDEIIGTDPQLRGDRRQGIDPLLRLADDLGLGYSTDRLIRMFDEAENHGFRPAEAADRDALIAAFDRLRATDPLWDGIRITERYGVEGVSDSTARALGEMARIVGSDRGSRPFAVDPLARMTEEMGLDYSLRDLAQLYTDAQERGYAPERAAARTELVDVLNRHRESSDPGPSAHAPADRPPDATTTSAAEDPPGPMSDARGDASAHSARDAVQESRLAADAELGHAREEVSPLTRYGDGERELAMERLRSLEARVDAWARWPDEPEVSYTADHEAFRQDYLRALSRAERGEPVVPYLYENATGGLGARDGGRAFGLELEISGPAANSTEMLNAIARDLHAHGLAQSADVHSYHAAKEAGYSDARNTWRVEFDDSVAGELVSPILFDEPETWQAIAKVCEIVTSHGGKVDFSTGGHIHVSTHDYDHIVENHHSVMRMADSYMDTLFRLGQNPDAYQHRGVAYCQPNEQLTTGYASIGEVTAGDDGHSLAVNMSGMHEGKQTDHIEFRMWDGSLDPAVIQTRVKLSLALTEAAFRQANGLLPPNGGLRDPLGAHLEERRLGADHEHPQGIGPAESLSFRRLMDDIFHRAIDKEQATALFAITRWSLAA